MTYSFNSQPALLQHLVDTRVASYGVEDQPAATAPTWEVNEQFIAMLNSYRRNGGLAQDSEVASMCNSAESGSLTLLADRVLKRELISIDWQYRIWIPLFQFNRLDMSLREGMRDVLAELVAVFSTWEVALWFSQPNPWLFHRTPADVTALSMNDVMHAARAERYVVAG